jgi:hypothetical protein
VGAAGSAASPVAVAPAAAIPVPRSTPLQIALVTLYAVVLLVPLAWLSISRSEGSLGFAVGEVIGRALIPAVVVILYYRKKPVSGARIVFFLVTWVFFTNLFVLGKEASNRKFPLTAADIPVIMREAAGLTPPPVPDPPERAALRDSYRALLERSRKYEAEIGRLNQTSEIKNLSQPQSFASLETMQATLKVLREEREVERVQGAALDDFVAEFGRKVEGFSWPRVQKQAFMRGLQKSLDEQSGERRAALKADLEWLDKTIGLYGFAAANHEGIRAGPKTVVIPDAKLREEFNRRAQEQEASRKRFLAAFQAWQQIQQEAQRKIGISGKDLGLGTQETTGQH